MPHHIKPITSLTNPVVKHLRGLSQKKNRDAEGLFIVEGPRHVDEMLEAGWVPACVAFSARAAGLPETQKALAACDAAAGLNLEVTDDILGKVTNRDNAQPLIGVFRQRFYGLEAVSSGPDALWLALEGIRDPGNLGTILRTADAAGASGVLLLGECCDVFAPEVVRATTGSFARMTLCHATQAEFLAWRPKWAGRVFGTHLKAESDYRRVAYELPLMLVMGSESAGMSEDITKACDNLLKIPMKGETESLNLAVSTGIMLYEAARERL
ncbi:MAG: RNA methyltransferase [Alphaproteobacteria bacterium]|nr:RNA methyltransferase [Alphaproteobacteria bacterium]